jgi:tetratricopeptide (TPR) repeat protein
MFEVLLQAGKALESGDLDQAEESYWQIVESDPSNAIAVAGLARVSMERGDRRLARTFAERALVLDPESAAARRTLEALDGGATAAPGPERPDLPLPTTLRPDASLRRLPANDADESAEDAADAEDDDSDEQVRRFPPEPLPDRRRGERPPDEAAAAEAIAPTADPPAAGAPAAGPPAAETIARPSGLIRPKTHQALGDRIRRHLVPEDGKTSQRGDDPFAAAESAAAIEAVGDTDDVAIDEGVMRAGRAPGQAPDKQGEVLGAVDATDEDESIAMRLALVSDAAGLGADDSAAMFGAIDEDESIAMRLALVSDAAQIEASELDAGQTQAAAELEAAQVEAAELEAAQVDEDVFGVAELVAAEELGSVPSRRIDLDAMEAGLQAAELRATQRGASGSGAAAPANLEAEDGPAADEPKAAGPASGALAAAHPIPEQIEEGTSEEDAEAAAFREALDLVLGDGSDGTELGTALIGATRPPQPARIGAPPPISDSRESAPEPPAVGDTPEEPSAAPEEEADSEATTEPRRKGFLRRFRGD